MSTKNIVEEFKERFAVDGLLHDVNGPLESEKVETWLTSKLTQLLQGIEKEEKEMKAESNIPSEYKHGYLHGTKDSKATITRIFSGTV